MKKVIGIGIGVIVIAIIGVAFGSTMMGKPGSEFNFGLPHDQDNKMQLSDEVTVKVNQPESTSLPPTTENNPEVTQPNTIHVNISDGVGTNDK